MTRLVILRRSTNCFPNPKQLALQKPEDCAREIEGALDWARNNDVPPEELASIPNFKKLPQQPSPPRPTVDRQKDLDRTLIWMRNKDKPNNDDINDTTGGLRKIDALLPKKPGQPLEDRAEDIENVLDWLRDRGVGLTDDEVPTSFTPKKMGSMPPRRMPEERAKYLEDVLNWTRRSPNDDTKDPTGVFTKLGAMLPTKPGQPVEDRGANDIENAMTWCRNNNIGVDIGDDSPENFKKLANIPMPDGRTPEQKAKDVENILNWVRSPKNLDEPQASPFQKVDQLVPDRPGQSPVDCAKDIDNVLKWLRNHGVDLEDDDTPFKPQLPGSVTPRRSPEDRAKDTEAALDWLRKKPNDDTRDPTGVFTKLDSMLPTKPGQPVENKLFRHRKKVNQTTNLPLLGRHPFCVQQQDEAIHF